MMVSPGITVATGVLALALVAGAGCGAQAPPKAVVEARGAAAPPLQQEKPVEVHSIAAVALAPGEEKSAVVVVDRKGNEGAITAQVADLPAGITATVGPASEAEGTARIEITVSADATLGDVDIDHLAKVTVAVGDKIRDRSWKLRVPRVSRVEVRPQPPFLIQPATSAVWSVPVDRHGFEGAVDFEAASSSEAIMVEGSTVAPDQSEVLVKITAARDASEGPAACMLAWTSYGRAMSIELPVQIVRQPFSLDGVVSIALRRGETREQALVLKRAGHTGPVSITFGPLPEGTHASPSSLTLQAESGSVTFSAEDSAPEGVAIVPVRASAGHLLATGLVAVRVLGDAPREIPPADAFADSPQRIRPGGVAARRAPAARQALARFYGATDDSGPAVRRALRWLASRQTDAGEWEAAAGDAATGANGAVAVTAMALLPFLAEGLTFEPSSAREPDMEPYPDVVKKGLVFLGKNQPEKGDQAGAIGGTMDAHLLGLMAFSEAFALSDNDDLKTRARLAVDRLAKFQGKKGEWAVDGGNTARDTALAVMALQAARVCGIGTAGGPLRKAAKHLETCRTPDSPPGSQFSGAAALPADAEVTAMCLLALQVAGRRSDAPEMAAGCDYLAGHAPAVGAVRTAKSPLFFVVAGEVLRNAEGERYDIWNAALRSFLTANQVQEGELAGSWDPGIFGGGADRVWATACATLCLQSHFRALPLDRTSAQDP